MKDKANAKDDKLVVNVSERDKRLLEAAAGLAGLNLSDFVRGAMLPIAQAIVSRDPVKILAITDGLGVMFRSRMMITSATAESEEQEWQKP